MKTQDLRKQYGIEDFFATNPISAKVVATKGRQRLSMYRPDPTTGLREPGTMIRFGLKDIDKMMSMLKGCYYLVAARPRTGKTAFLMQVAYEAMRQLHGSDKLVVIFSAEMDSASLSLREACSVEKLSYWAMAQGELDQEEYDRLDVRLQHMGRESFWLDESSAPSTEHMAAKLASFEEAGKSIGLVLFDYLELAGDMAGDEVRRIATIGRGLKALAKKFDCPVMALGQLNREIEKKGKDRKPGLSDLMYGGEREPDGILVLDRPWLIDDTAPKNLVEVHVVKHRHGPGGSCHLVFDESTMRFQSAEVKRIELNMED